MPTNKVYLFPGSKSSPIIMKVDAFFHEKKIIHKPPSPK